MSWVWNIENGNYDRAQIGCSDDARALEVGQMLWSENVASVEKRYPDSDDLPSTIDEDPYQYTTHVGNFGVFRYPAITPEQVLAACDCYEYQSCEHPGWSASEACAFINALRSRAWHALPGYEKAQWSIS
tara:strand:+ start:538 stop:927 length:390 start_codon:yes stop_codon:yes gene_type:complete